MRRQRSVEAVYQSVCHGDDGACSVRLLSSRDESLEEPLEELQPCGAHLWPFCFHSAGSYEAIPRYVARDVSRLQWGGVKGGELTLSGAACPVWFKEWFIIESRF